MGLLDHLDELRRRIFRSLIAFVLCFGAAWTFHQRIYTFLERPIRPHLPEGKKLIFLAPTESFVLYLKVAALAGVFIASPFVLYQLWSFVAPGLYRREKRMAIPFIFFGSSLFLAGGAFAYYVAFPFAIEFLLGFGHEQFEAQITVTRYLGFLMTVILGLGLMFELPTLILLLAKLGLVTPRFLLRHSRYAIVLIFVAAAILTPTPDVFNLCIFALPTIALYFLGILLAYLVRPREPKI